MGERTALLCFLILATQLRLGSAQVLRIGERNSCLRTEPACLKYLRLSQTGLSFFISFFFLCVCVRVFVCVCVLVRGGGGGGRASFKFQKNN